MSDLEAKPMTSPDDREAERDKRVEEIRQKLKTTGEMSIFDAEDLLAKLDEVQEDKEKCRLEWLQDQAKKREWFLSLEAQNTALQAQLEAAKGRCGGLNPNPPHSDDMNDMVLLGIENESLQAENERLKDRCKTLADYIEKEETENTELKARVEELEREFAALK